LIRRRVLLIPSLIRRRVLLIPLLDKEGLGAVDNANSNSKF